MVTPLIQLAINYLNDELSTDKFVDEYLDAWINDKKRVMGQQDEETGDVASSIMIACDAYEPDADPDDEYELTAEQLKKEVEMFLSKIKIKKTVTSIA